MDIEQANKRRNNLLMISFSLDQAGHPRFEFQLDEKEYGVVGYALVHWSFMEHVLLQSTIELADALGVAVPKNARQDSLRRRLAVFREVALQIKIEKLQTRFLNLADRIANANGFRQRLTHGVWSYEMADPDILHLEVSRYATDGPQEFLNAERIYNFAEMVSEPAPTIAQHSRTDAVRRSILAGAPSAGDQGA